MGSTSPPVTASRAALRIKSAWKHVPQVRVSAQRSAVAQQCAPDRTVLPPRLALRWHVRAICWTLHACSSMDLWPARHHAPHLQLLQLTVAARAAALSGRRLASC